jgi:hypothetical protein
MNAGSTSLPPSDRPQRDPLAAIAAPLAPIVLEGRYRLLVGALWRLGRSRKGRRALAAGSGALVLVLALLAARHFASTSWPLASGNPGVLVAAGLLLLLAQVFKAYGWGRLFTPDERPKVLALAAGNGGAALVGVVLPGRFDDAMRVAVVRRYPGCPAGVRVLCLSLRRAASQAWALVSACWLVRAVALFLLLGTLGVGFSFPLALLFLCSGAAARRCRSVRRVRQRRSASVARPSSPRVSGHPLRSAWLSPSELWESSPAALSFSSPWRGAPRDRSGSRARYLR